MDTITLLDWIAIQIDDAQKEIMRYKSLYKTDSYTTRQYLGGRIDAFNAVQKFIVDSHVTVMSDMIHKILEIPPIVEVDKEK